MMENQVQKDIQAHLAHQEKRKDHQDHQAR